MRRRIIKRTEITERVMVDRERERSVGGGETYRVSILRDGAAGSQEICRSEPIAKIEIDESAEGVFSLKGKAKRIL